MHREPKNGYGPFEAISRKPNREVLRTRHKSWTAAKKRLSGNPRHSEHEVVDHRPEAERKSYPVAHTG